jgi:GT2 family glycosyltransferase
VEAVEPVVTQGRVVGQRLRRRLSRHPAVSLVIPTRGSTSVIDGRPRRHIVELLRSVWVPERYPDLEVVVVADRETPADVVSDLRALIGDDLVLVPYEEEFNFSRKCNLGALAARGEYVCFLNDDTEVRTGDWLHEMVGRLADPGVGGVGARLVFADGTLQHIGHSYSSGDAGHPLFGWWPATLEIGAAAQLAGERVGVTAACLLVRTSDFLAVGGFSENLPLNYNDVDLCLKLREAGFRLVYTPHAELYHFESQTRVARVLDSEVRQIRRRWTTRMRSDSYLRLHRGHHLRRRFARPERETGFAAQEPAVDPPTTVEAALPSTGGER